MSKLIHRLWSISKLQVFSIKSESFLYLSILCPKGPDQFYTSCIFFVFSLKAGRLLTLCTSGNKTYEVSVVCENNDYSDTGCKRLFCFLFCVGHTKLTELSTSQFIVAVKSMRGNSFLRCCRGNSSVEDWLLLFCTCLTLDLLPG